MQLKSKIYSWLRKSEKYTQTDNVYLAKGGFWLFLSRFAASASSFFVAVAFANLLDPSLYGTYKYILSLVGFLSIFTLKGMGTALTQAVSRGFEGGFYSLFKTRLKVGALQSLGVMILGAYYLCKDNFLLALPLFFIAWLLPLRSGFSLIYSFLPGKKNFSLNAKYQSSQGLFSGALLIIFLFLTNYFSEKTTLIILGLVGIYFLSETLLNGIFYYQIKKKLKPNKQDDEKTKKYGYHLTIVNFLGQIIQYLDQILVFHSLGAAQLAMYTFALLPVDKMREPAQMLSILALPKFSAKNTTDLKTNLLPKILKMLVLTGVFIIAYIIIAPFAFKIFFPKYLMSIPYSQIYAVSLLGMAYLIFNTALTSQMAIKKIYSLKIITAIVDIILSVVGFFTMGILGIILARVLSEIIRSTLGFWAIKKL